MSRAVCAGVASNKEVDLAARERLVGAENRIRSLLPDLPEVDRLSASTIRTMMKYCAVLPTVAQAWSNDIRPLSCRPASLHRPSTASPNTPENDRHGE